MSDEHCIAIIAAMFQTSEASIQRHGFPGDDEAVDWAVQLLRAAKAAVFAGKVRPSATVQQEAA